RTSDIDETQYDPDQGPPAPLLALRSWMAEALSETLPQREHRPGQGIGDDSRNVERLNKRSLDAHSQRCQAQQQDLHSCLLTQVARHVPEDGEYEQEEPFHQEDADERVVPGGLCLSMWRSLKAKRAQYDTNEGYEHRYEGADQESAISLSHAQSNEQEVARQKRREDVTQR